MVQMGEQFGALNRKMVGGVMSLKFSDQDFQEMTSQCDNLIRATKEYAGMETDKDLASIAASLASSAGYLKQQLAGKDAMGAAMSYGRVMSFCAECHYRARW
jgi:hypothetical protein